MRLHSAREAFTAYGSSTKAVRVGPIESDLPSSRKIFQAMADSRCDWWSGNDQSSRGQS
jgi:hypothetical protein